MQDQGPGGPERLRPPLDDSDVGTVVMGLQGQDQPGWARAGHQDGGRSPHETLTGHHQDGPAASSGKSLRCSLGSTW